MTKIVLVVGIGERHLGCWNRNALQNWFPYPEFGKPQSVRAKKPFV
jgi:hypothetical protein